MSDSMRVRFAPSPTGALHVGGARAALYNWLLARGRQGTFVLRIEDTDRERSTPENIEQILDALRWLELDWDEGPVFQSERAPRHKEEIARLVDEGRGYLAEGAVRLRVPEAGETVVRDVIRGEIAFRNADIADFVIARSDGRKLSKRHGAASVQALRDAGYLPAAVRNFLAVLGWGYDEVTTFFTTEELIKLFSLDRVSRNPAVFDEQKLRWMNGRYLRAMDRDELTALLERRLGRSGLSEAVGIAQEKMQTLDDFWRLAGFLVERRPTDDQAWSKVIEDAPPERL